MTEWQSIETAPKNTYILTGYYLFNVNPEFEKNDKVPFFVGTFYSHIAYFMIDKKSKSKKGKWYSSTEDEIEEPTHWMPLPEPPKITLEDI